MERARGARSSGTQSRSKRPVRTTRSQGLNYSEASLASDLSRHREENHDDSSTLPGQVSRRGRARGKRPRVCGPADLSLPTPAKRPVRTKTQAGQAKELKQESTVAKPPWATLPYHILFSIFFNISASAESPLADVSQSVKCLLALSRMCRAFFEPAITALYFSPPLVPVAKARGLLELLKKDQDTLFLNYRSKVRCLEIDPYGVKSMLIYSLLKHTPRLNHLRLYDLGEYNGEPSVGRNIPRWLFCDMPQPDALRKLRLYSWEWNSEVTFPSIKTVHRHPAFTSLRSVRFYNLEHHSSGRQSDSPEELDYKDFAVQAGEIASAVSLLPNVERLEFKQCKFVRPLLPLLPNNLVALSIINCARMDSSVIEEFLFTHGHNLRELTFRHNCSLGMSFAARLSEFCPNLRSFIVDFNLAPRKLSRGGRYYPGSEGYDHLLLDQELPSFPSSLQWLELQYMRKWDIAAAEAFFNSLIDSAPHLRDLRTLILTVIMEVDWRDRAVFRDRWVRKLEQVFLRNSPPPSGSVSSLKPPSSPATYPSSPTTQKRKQSDDPVPARRSKRIATRAVRAECYYDGSDSDEGSEHEDGTEQEQNGSMPLLGDRAKQGMCSVVKVRIDNIRPGAVLLPAEDISEEESDDAEWDGVDAEIDDSYAW